MSVLALLVATLLGAAIGADTGHPWIGVVFGALTSVLLGKALSWLRSLTTYPNPEDLHERCHMNRIEGAP